MSQIVVLFIGAGLVLTLLALGLTPFDPGELEPRDGQSIRFVSPFVYNAPGNDWRSLNEEFVTLQNDGEGPRDLSGWTLRNENRLSYAFPQGFVLAAGARVTVHSGCGDDSEDDLYWCASSPVWDDNKGVATLVTADGDKAAIHAYERLCETCGDKEQE
jgi:hypothetical protein